MIPNMFQVPKVYVKLEVPTIGSRALFSLHCGGEASQCYRKFSDSIAHLLSVDPTITPAILEKAMLQKF